MKNLVLCVTLNFLFFINTVYSVGKYLVLFVYVGAVCEAFSAPLSQSRLIFTKESIHCSKLRVFLYCLGRWLRLDVIILTFPQSLCQLFTILHWNFSRTCILDIQVDTTSVWGLIIRPFRYRRTPGNNNYLITTLVDYPQS